MAHVLSTEIFRLDAIERYIVTIYHIVAKNSFPK